MTEKHWYLIDDCTRAKGQIFETRINVSDASHAAAIAEIEWKALSPHDQALRDAFYIGFAALDDDGCIDYDSMTDIVSIK